MHIELMLRMVLLYKVYLTFITVAGIICYDEKCCLSFVRRGFGNLWIMVTCLDYFNRILFKCFILFMLMRLSKIKINVIVRFLEF